MTKSLSASIILFALWAIPSAAVAQAQSVEIAFVANAQDGTVVLLDVAKRAIVGRVDVNPTKAKTNYPGTPNFAQDTDLSPDGRTLYVSRGYLGDVAAFDIGTGKLLWNTALNTGRTDHMTISRDGRHLFVSAIFDNRLYRVETVTGKVAGHVVAGVYPHDNKVSRDGRLLYNTSIGTLGSLPRTPGSPQPTERPGAPFQLTIVDVGTFQIRDRIVTDQAIRPWEFAPDERGMYVQLANKHAVAFFDLTSRRFTRQLDLPVKPGITAADVDFEAPHHGLAITPDGRTLCLAARTSDYAGLVSAPDLKLITTVPVGDGPGWAEVADNGRVCMTTNGKSDDVSIISIADRKEIVRIRTGDGPKHITVERIPTAVVDAARARMDPRGD